MEYNYNTQRKKLILPEYGRNIQKMINHLHEIEDSKERNFAAKTIILIMQSMAPYGKDHGEQKRKLWDHMALISDFKLDLDTPFELPDKESLKEKPKPIPYNSNHIKIKHYGRGIELLIDYAITLKDGEEKDYLVLLIANHMKRSFLNWNKNAVNDEVIFADLKKLSDGKLAVKEGISLTDSRDMLSKPRKKRPPRKK